MIAEPRRLLIRSVNWLGDAVMTTPALLRLRARLPGARIVILTAAGLGDLWRGHPAVDEIVTFSAGDSLSKVAALARETRSDAALILPNSPRSALEAWRAGIPRRIGSAAGWRRWLFTDAVPGDPASTPMRKRSPGAVRRWAARADAAPMRRPAWGPESHHMRHYLRLASRLGADPTPLAPQVFVGPDEKDRLASETASQVCGRRPAGPWIGLCPSAAYGPAKRWPADRFVAVAKRALESGAGAVLILGSQSDRTDGDRIAGEIGPNAFNLAGRTTLRSLMALLASCDVVLTNDSGPMHLAAALGSRVVAIFGSTEPSLTAPGLPGDGHAQVLCARAGCAPCFLRMCPIDLRCQRAVSVDEVSRAVVRALTQR